MRAFWLLLLSVLSLQGDIALADVSVPSSAAVQYRGIDFGRSYYIYRPTGIYMPDTSGNTMLLKAPNLANDNTVFTFPPTNGTAGQVLATDGTGVTAWQDAGISEVSDDNVASDADIARSKLASGTANHVVINDGSGVMSSEATLSPSRGGTGVANVGTLTLADGDDITLETVGATSVTLPQTGTLSTLAGVETLSDKSFDTITQLLDGKAVHFLEDSGNGTDYIGLKAPAALSGPTVFTLPEGDGSAGDCLKSDGSAAFGWTGCASKTDNLSVFAATTSAELFGVISDETGTGVLVGSTSPELTTPVVRESLLLQNESGSAPELQLSEDPDSGTATVTLKAPADLTGGDGSYVLTMPGNDGDSGDVLTTNGSGVLSWSSPGANSVIPPGTVTMFAGSSAPTGWLLCDGTSYAEADYAGLHGAIGDAYNTAVDTSTGLAYSDPGDGNFRVPDLRSVFVRGVGTAHNTVATTLGQWRDDSTATNGLAAPSHTHSIDHDHGSTTSGNESAHTHSIAHDHGSFTSGNESAHIHTFADQTANVYMESESFGGSVYIRGAVGGTTGSSGSVVVEASGLTHDFRMTGTNITDRLLANVSGATGTGSSHNHSVDPPNFTGTSGAGSSHNHSVDLPNFTGTSGDASSTTISGDTETRPVSVGLNYIIKMRTAFGHAALVSGRRRGIYRSQSKRQRLVRHRKMYRVAS